MKVNSHLSEEILIEEYRSMEEYLYNLPCGCYPKLSRGNQFASMNLIHRNLYEHLNNSSINVRMNNLDEKRRKKIFVQLESIQNWISKDIEFDRLKPYETIKELNKIVRVLQQMSFDVIHLFFFINLLFLLFKDSTIITRYLSLDDFGFQTCCLCSSST